VSASDPYAVLQIDPSATMDEVRAARRRLAFDRHPDRGGSVEAMRELNVAFDAIVAHLTGRRPLLTARREPEPPPAPAPASSRRAHVFSQVQYDAPSFVIDALPAEAFEALLVVTSWIGDVLVDDPPYLLDVHLLEPGECWCRLDLVPDAGATTVSLTVAGVDGAPAPFVEDVRDTWVRNLNAPGAFD
jgi:hypothetical protein